MIKVVNIEGVDRKMASSAILVRQYRAHFGKDLIVEMTKAMRQRLKAANKKLSEVSEEDIELEDIDQTVFENLGWLMLRNAGEDVGDTPDEWLETLESPLTVYNLMGVITDLWSAGLKTTAIPKKK